MADEALQLKANAGLDLLDCGDVCFVEDKQILELSDEQIVGIALSDDLCHRLRAGEVEDTCIKKKINFIYINNKTKAPTSVLNSNNFEGLRNLPSRT